MNCIFKVKGSNQNMEKFLIENIFINYIYLEDKNMSCASIRLIDDLKKNKLDKREHDNLIIYSPKEREVQNVTFIFQNYSFNLSESDYPEDESYFISTYNDNFNTDEEYFYLSTETDNKGNYYLESTMMVDENKIDELKAFIEKNSDKYHLDISVSCYDNTKLKEVNIFKEFGEELIYTEFNYDSFEDFFFNQRLV